MKHFFPYKIINYTIVQFLNSLFVVFLVFLSLALLINFVEEMTFFKDKNLENFTSLVSYLAICKTINTLIELSIFIFLFSGILFFVKIQKNNEIGTILLSGLSKLTPILTATITSFVIGLFIIFFLTPISSNTLKIYEQIKRTYSSIDNLIVINRNGLWFMENLSNEINIIRADRILDNNFNILKNITIYTLDKNFNFLKRIDSDIAYIKNKNWIIEKPKFLFSNSNDNLVGQEKFSNINFISTIKLDELKEYFSNADTVSFWEITNNIEKLNQRGYSANELRIKFHKYLSLPIYLFGVVLLSTLFTIGIKNRYNTLVYLFFGLITGFILYFLNNLSIAIGLSNKLPLTISVWAPIVIIILLSIINLIRINEN